MPRKRKDYSSAITMYNSGLSIEKVASFSGVSRQAIWEALKSRGVEFRSQVRSGSDNSFFTNGNASLSTRRKPAHRAIENARNNGLVSPEQCSACDRKCKVHAHHDDYGKPLDVRWLCRKCHFAWHKTNIAKEIS